jgi:ribosomal protein S18 acetylase RimI-like enzyme
MYKEKEIDITGDKVIAERIREIYENSFPEDERRDFTSLSDLLVNNEDIHISLFAENGLVNAFIIYWNFTDFIYIEHFAVDRKFRGQGWGTKIMQAFMNNVQTPIVMEVELPHDDISRKRIAFYERLSFAAFPQPYVQPSYGEGKREVEMRLMRFGQIDFEYVKSTLYAKVYAKG